MTETVQLEELTLPEVPPATDADIITYLRRSCKIAEFADAAERNALILSLCEQHGITVSEEEWQAAGDAFRLEHKLLGLAETHAWLAEQRTNVEDWSEGIKAELLAKNLKEHFFGAAVDGHYVSNRDTYKRVALSQILVQELTDALKIALAIREEKASFCALALEHSKGKQSQENGGFVGIRFLAELIQEVAQAIAEAKAGEVIGPVRTKLGYHILRVEKWFLPELSEALREQILEVLFQAWLQEQRNDNSSD